MGNKGLYLGGFGRYGWDGEGYREGEGFLEGKSEGFGVFGGGFGGGLINESFDGGLNSLDGGGGGREWGWEEGVGRGG